MAPPAICRALLVETATGPSFVRELSVRAAVRVATLDELLAARGSSTNRPRARMTTTTTVGPMNADARRIRGNGSGSFLSAPD